MKKLLLVFLAVCLVPYTVFAATTFNDTSADHKWSTAANWSDGKPDASDAVTVHADVTAINIDEAATCLSFDTTAATGAVTISGTGALTVSGSFTLEAGGAWTNTGILTFTTNAATINTAAVSLGTAASVKILGGCDATLGGAINTGTKALYVHGAGSSMDSANYQIDCGIFGDNAQAGAVTLTLGTSTINCVNVAFPAATLTVTANTAAVNVAATGTLQTYFGAATWGGTTTLTLTAGALPILNSATTFGNLTVVFNNGGGGQVGGGLILTANQVVSGTLTLTANTIAPDPLIYGGSFTRRTITAGTVTATGAMDFRDIAGAGAGSWDLSGIASGNAGGNTGITFRSPATYYLACEANVTRQNYHNVFSTADDGTPDGLAVFPLPQDTLIINDNSFTNTGQQFLVHSGTRSGTFDASALTKAEDLNLPRECYGDLIFTGANTTIFANVATTTLDGRLKNEGSDTLDVNIPMSSASNIIMGSVGGSVKLLSNLSVTTPFTHTRGTLDLNGKTLTSTTFLSTNSNTRTIQDSAGGGKIVLNGLTGTIFDTTTATNLTISNAPDIDIGDSDNTLTGNVTFIGSAKTFGDFTVKKHAGNYDCIITGSNTFGALTLETPDATYNYSDIQFTAGTTTTVSSFAAVGTATYPIAINSATASAHTLTDTAGANAVQYCSIAYSQAGGGAAWTASNSTDGGNNTGWGFGRKRIFHVIGN